MTWTATTFKARWPEFAPVADATVTLVLAEALRRHDPRLFPITGALDDAVGLLTAHLLSISPYGQQARLEGEKAGEGTGTTYWSEWKKLCRNVAGGPWTVGQLP